MKKTKIPLIKRDTKDHSNPKTLPIKSDENGTVETGSEKDLTKYNDALPVTLRPDSLLPFPNIDQVESPSTNLIDDTTKQLRELMISVGRSSANEENLFKTAGLIKTACDCAKNINSLLRTKLDIYKAYHKK